MVIWNTGLAAERARARAQRDAAQFNLKLKEKKIKKRVRAQASKRPSFAQQGPGFPDSCNNLFDREVE